MSAQETVRATPQELLTAGQALGLVTAHEVLSSLYRTAVLTSSLDEVARTVVMEMLTAVKSAGDDMVSRSPLAFALLYSSPEPADEQPDASDPDL